MLEPRKPLAKALYQRIELILLRLMKSKDGLSAIPRAHLGRFIVLVPSNLLGVYRTGIVTKKYRLRIHQLRHMNPAFLPFFLVISRKQTLEKPSQHLEKSEKTLARGSNHPIRGDKVGISSIHLTKYSDIAGFWGKRFVCMWQTIEIKDSIIINLDPSAFPSPV